MAIGFEGQVFTWGYGVSGVLGHGDYQSQLKPKLVDLGSKHAIQGECGGYHNGVVTSDGQLYMWGRADAG
jgi:alpha-tubulin suppressor-like RCC1 family protein